MSKHLFHHIPTLIGIVMFIHTPVFADDNESLVDSIAVMLINDNLLVTEDRFNQFYDNKLDNNFHNGFGIVVEMRAKAPYYVGIQWTGGEESDVIDELGLAILQQTFGATGGYFIPLLDDQLFLRFGGLLGLHQTRITVIGGDSTTYEQSKYGVRAGAEANMVASAWVNELQRNKIELLVGTRLEGPIRPIFEPLGRFNAGWFSFQLGVGFSFGLSEPDTDSSWASERRAFRAQQPEMEQIQAESVDPQPYASQTSPPVADTPKSDEDSSSYDATSDEPMKVRDNGDSTADTVTEPASQQNKEIEPESDTPQSAMTETTETTH